MNSLQKIPAVKDIHHTHAWTITSGVNIFTTHIKTDDLSKSGYFKRVNKNVKRKI
jgi:cobalt-zinc-cadmium efflux system protein